MYSLRSFKRVYLLLLLPSGVLLRHILSFFPNAVEQFYSKGMNRLTIRLLSNVTGVFPFSVAELLLVLLVISLIWHLIWAVIVLVVMTAHRHNEPENGSGMTHKGLVRTIFILVKKKTINKGIITDLLNVFALISILYFGFILLWGLNYYRLPFADIAHLKVRPASIEELANVCEIMIARANTLRKRVDEDKDGVMRISGGKSYIFNCASATVGYQKAAKKYPSLGGMYGKPKRVFLSNAMSYAGISGVYVPFTGEANINTLIPDAILPCTICHEMAHQRGFAREDEAEYIAYVTCNLNSNTDYQYSGTLLALIRSVEMLGVYDIKKYNQLQKRYNSGVNRDLTNISAFLDKYEGPFNKIASDINDIYLKSNSQKEGINSYNRMVDLLIAEYRAKMLRARSRHSPRS